MLRIKDLKEFLALAQSQIPAIKDTLMVASETRYARKARDIRHEGDDVFLIALLPGARPLSNDEDNVRFGNNLSFMCIRKLDGNAGDDAYTEAFEISQDATLALFKFIHDQTSNFEGHCVFKHFVMSSLQILPVENFHNCS